MQLKIFKNEETEGLNDIDSLTQELQDEFEVIIYDMDEPDTIQPAEIYQIFNTPTFVVTDADGREINSWRGLIPPIDELKNYLSQ